MSGDQALVVVDLQNDFCPGGALPVKDGDKIVAPVNRLVAAFEAAGLPMFFTRDWHPKDHCSFKDQGGIWPPHCVQRTTGARFHPSLNVPKNAIVISKATQKEKDAYSGFYETDLAEKLRRAGANKVFVCGLATDYCVKNTVLDAVGLGFQTYVVTDCVKGVDMKPADSSNALRTISTGGAGKTTSARIVREIGRRVAMSSSS